MQKHFPIATILMLIGFIAVVNGAAVYWHLYFYVWWLDIPMHMLGGTWVALFTLSSYYRFPNASTKDTSPLFVFAFGVAITMIVGLSWELFEFSAQTFIERAQVFNIGDTLSDLVNDFIGAMIASFVFVRMGYNKLI